MAIARTYADAAPDADLPPLQLDPIAPLSLALFAGGSGDHNPIHIDRDFARANGFDEVFAHGMLSMAYLGRLLAAWAPPERIKRFSCRFVSITPLRAAVACTGVIRELLVEQGRRHARVDLTASLPDGVVTLKGEALVLLD